MICDDFTMIPTFISILWGLKSLYRWYLWAAAHRSFHPASDIKRAQLIKATFDTTSTAWWHPGSSHGYGQNLNSDHRFLDCSLGKKPPRPMGDLMSWGIISGLMKEFISTKRPWFPWTGSKNGITGNHVETWRYREKISGRRIWKKRCEDDSHVNTMGIHGIKPRVLHEVGSLSSTFGPMMSGPINLRSTHRNYACRVPRFEKVGAGPQLIHSMCESAPIPTSAFSFLSGCAWIPCIP